MMHLCFITHEYPKMGYAHGGIGSFVKTVASELVKNGMRVSVVGINYTNEYENIQENGIHIYRLPPTRVKGLSWWFNARSINKKIGEIHQEHPIAIVEASELGFAFIHKIKDIKYVVRLHGGHHFFSEAENRGINFWKGIQEKRSFARADAFIAVSEYVKAHTEKYLSYHGKPVALISSPIDDSLFYPIQMEVVPHRIVFAGTVCEKKGIRQLIQAFPLLKKEFPDATLEIYGRDWFFPDGSSYMAMLEEKELPSLGVFASDVHFNGTVQHTGLPQEYAKAEVCVFPSHMETQGLVAPEAMLMGKMVVFTQLGPGPEAIAHYETGLLCDPYDPMDIAAKIAWAFSNKAQSKAIGKRASEFATQKYGLLPIIAKNIQFYQTLQHQL